MTPGDAAMLRDTFPAGIRGQVALFFIPESLEFFCLAVATDGRKTEGQDRDFFELSIQGFSATY